MGRLWNQIEPERDTAYLALVPTPAELRLLAIRRKHIAEMQERQRLGLPPLSTEVLGKPVQVLGAASLTLLDPASDARNAQIYCWLCEGFPLKAISEEVQRHPE
jgi:hypothetical protein